MIKNSKTTITSQPAKENLRKETTDNITFEGEMLNALSVRARRRQGYSRFHFYSLLHQRSQIRREK